MSEREREGGKVRHTLMDTVGFLHSFIYYCSYEVICLISCHSKLNSNVAIVKKNDCMNKIFYKKKNVYRNKMS